MTKKVTAWSYSRLACFESCPFLHKCRNIDKLDEPKGDAMFRGIKIHNEAAKFLAGETDIFPSSCESFRDQFYELRDMTPIVEQKWAFNDKWRSVGYFDKTVKLRVILDVGLTYSDGTADVIDHKTGKRYDDDYTDQLGLFAAAVIKKFPKTQHVTSRLWYLDSGDEVIMEFTRDEALAVLEDLEERAEVMMAAKRFPPRPSWKCGGVKRDGTVWGCHFRASNGGPCEYG